MLRFFTLFSFFIFPEFISLGQPKGLEFESFYSNQRLSKTMVSWMDQDSKGFLWIATESGLFKYDGYSFLPFVAHPSNNEALPANLLLSICNAPEGDMWIGSFSGLVKYQSKKGTFLRYNPDPDTLIGTKGNFVHRVVNDRKGNLWVGTSDGLHHFNTFTNSFQAFPFNSSADQQLSNLQVRSLYIDRSGNIWVGTENGLNRIDARTLKVSRYFHDPHDNYSLSNSLIRSILEDKAGNLWIGTEKGLNKLDVESGKFQRFLHKAGDPNSLTSDTVLSLMEDKFKNLWIGTWKGLSILNPQRNNFSRYYHYPYNPKSLSGNTISALYTDNSGGIWVGTNKGLNRVEVNKKRFTHYFYNEQSYSNLSNSVSALLEDKKDTYWIGTKNFLVKFDKKNVSYERIYLKWDKDIFIFALNKDKNGVLWLGTNRGLFSYKQDKDEFTSYQYLINHDIWDIHIDRDGIFWIGTINGMYKYNQETKSLIQYTHQPGNYRSLSNDKVGTIVEDRNGNLWIGTWLGGLNKFDKKTGEFVCYQPKPKDPESISSATITVVFEDSKGTFWIGTMNGLNRFDKEKGTFTHFPERHFPFQDVRGIQEDSHHNLWITYPEGLCKYNIEKQTHNHYQGSDGLQIEYNVEENLRNSKGEIVLGGTNGLTVFHPDSIRENKFIPPVVITDFHIFNKPVFPDGEVLNKHITETKEITLSHNQFIFSFEFAALNFTNPEKNQYAYKLEGFEDDWNYVGNRRFASYSNIPAGETYLFKVKGSNNDGVWNNEGTAIRIYITPPFWDTAWFKLLSICLVASIGFTFYKLRVRRFQHYQRQLEKEVKERTTEISYQKERIEKQAEEIERINQLLKHDNEKLEENVKGLSEARVMRKQVTFEEFRQIYPDDDACLKFLVNLKWGKGYACIKCGNQNFSTGPVPYSRRCSTCSTIERATSNTIFSRMKFPITKAFYLLFLVSQSENITVDELAETLSHPRQTCWSFKKRIVEIMHARRNIRNNKDGWSHLILND